MAVTHDMIAAKLGINRTTVTKALKGDHSIKKATRKKVLETATLMGYDFKQSQQNRREGKRYFIQEHVTFRIMDPDSNTPISEGRGLLTNLSTTGALIHLKGPELIAFPLKSFVVNIQLPDDLRDMAGLPESRVVRINYYTHAEMATKFQDGRTLSEEFLLKLEAKAFVKVDRDAAAVVANNPPAHPRGF